MLILVLDYVVKREKRGLPEVVSPPIWCRMKFGIKKVKKREKDIQTSRLQLERRIYEYFSTLMY